MRKRLGIFLTLCLILCGPAAHAQETPNFAANVFSPGMMAKFSPGILYDQTTVQTPAWGRA